MRYLVTLTPLEPYLFGGENTYGKLGDEVHGTYLVKSRQFPQQSAILGMLKKELMTQHGVLTRKVRGEWVDKEDKNEAKTLVGQEKFDILASTPQNFGAIKAISPVFLMQDFKRYLKKVDSDSFPFKDGVLTNDYSSKKEQELYDNFISLDEDKKLSSNDIFEEVVKVGNKIGAEDNSLFKKTSYILKDNFKFAFYLECEHKLVDSIVTLGADRSSFKLELKEDNGLLDYKDNNGYLTLLSDSYIRIPLKDNCEFAITSEISYQNLIGKKSSMTKKDEPEKNKQNNPFLKSDKVFLYEKGSVIINPNQTLLDNLNNKNLQQIGYNIYTMGEIK